MNLFLKLIFSIKIRRIKKLFQLDNTTPCLYLGKNLIAKRYFERSLGNKFMFQNVSRLHNAITDEIREEYVAWIDSLNYLNAKKTKWWFNNISSRDAENTSIFQFFVYIELIKKIYSDKANSLQLPKLIILESPTLAKNISDWFLNQNFTVKVTSNRLQLENLFDAWMRLFKTYLKFIIINSSRYLASLISKALFKRKKIIGFSSIVVDTYLKNTNISKDGQFSDSYFPSLYQYLNKNGFHIIVHPKFFGFGFNYLPFLNKLRKSATHFIIREDFLALKDYLNALFYPLWFLTLKIATVDFRGIDTKGIIKEEKFKQLFFSCMDAVLTYRLFIRLKKEDFQPVEVIQWFENQVIDKALIAGCRKSFPKTKLIGAQLFIHSPNLVSLIPSESEVKANIAPDILLETSAYQCRIVNRFTDSLSCFPAASLRYANVFNDQQNKCPDFKNNRPNRALALLPYDIMESVEILEMIIEAVNKLSFKLEILVKPHPITELNLILKYLTIRRLPDNFQPCFSDLYTAFKDVDFVISSASSTMAEAIARGLPVICLGRKNALNFNPVAGIDIPFATECFSSDELLSAIKRYIDISQFEKTNYKEMGLKLRSLFFTPINDITLEPFINQVKQELTPEPKNILNNEIFNNNASL